MSTGTSIFSPDGKELLSKKQSDKVERNMLICNAPINVKLLGGGGEAGHRWGI